MEEKEIKWPINIEGEPLKISKGGDLNVFHCDVSEPGYDKSCVIIIGLPHGGYLLHHHAVESLNRISDQIISAENLKILSEKTGLSIDEIAESIGRCNLNLPDRAEIKLEEVIPECFDIKLIGHDNRPFYQRIQTKGNKQKRKYPKAR